MKTWVVRRIAQGVGFVLVAATVLGLVVMGLWNALVPELFHGPNISFWQGVGLLVLAHILLRGWVPWRFGHGWRHERWRRRFDEKLAAMTPEERAKYQEQWRCHRGWEGEKTGASEK